MFLLPHNIGHCRLATVTLLAVISFANQLNDVELFSTDNVTRCIVLYSLCVFRQIK